MLAIDCDAVFQLLLTLVVALEVNLIIRIVGVADDPEKGELIGALGRSLGGFPRGRVSPALAQLKVTALRSPRPSVVAVAIAGEAGRVALPCGS